MSEKREWAYINVRYSDGRSITIHQEDFKKMEQIKDVLDALMRVRGMKRDLDRLLGGSDP